MYDLLAETHSVAINPPVFDGHNDALLRLWMAEQSPIDLFQREEGAVSMPAMARGGMAGGFFAIFPADCSLDDLFDRSVFKEPSYDLPLPPRMDQQTALCVTIEQAQIARSLHDAGHVRLVKSVADIDAAIDGRTPALLLHLEGAEAIGPDLEELETLYDLGLRSVGPVWSRPTIFAHGVPFRFPSTGDTGDGLTDAGRRLVSRATDKGMVVDCSHMTERGFWDVAETGAPLVATHSNAHAIAPSSRNLTDAQLRAIGETGGMVGLNFGTFFLRPDGRDLPDGGLDAAMRHLDHMIATAGEGHVGFGSDFDGAPMPNGLRDAGDLTNLRVAMVRHGFGERLVARLCHGNWRDHLAGVLVG